MYAHRVLVLAALVVPALGGRALADDAAAARRNFEQGMKHYNVGEYREALQSFKDGYFAKADPTFLFNMGQCYRMLGDPEGAVRQYRAYLRYEPQAANRGEVEKFISDAEEELRRRAAERPPMGVEPPKETVAPTAKSEPAPAAATATGEPPPLYRRPLLWIVVGAVVVAAATVAMVLALVPNDAAPTSTELGATAVHF